MISISVAPVFAARWLVWRLHRFADVFPGARVQVEATIDLVDPRREGIDACIRVGTGHWPGLRVAEAASAELINIEIVCGDNTVHRARVEARASDLEGLKVPTWEKVLAREYEPWTGDLLVVDTSLRTVEDCVEEVVLHLDRVSTS